jgi:hypothetical protein
MMMRQWQKVAKCKRIFEYLFNIKQKLLVRQWKTAVDHMKEMEKIKMNKISIGGRKLEKLIMSRATRSMNKWKVNVIMLGKEKQLKEDINKATRQQVRSKQNKTNLKSTTLFDNGYCYLHLFKPEDREEIKQILDPNISAWFLSLLLTGRYGKDHSAKVTSTIKNGRMHLTSGVCPMSVSKLLCYGTMLIGSDEESDKKEDENKDKLLETSSDPTTNQDDKTSESSDATAEKNYKESESTASTFQSKVANGASSWMKKDIASPESPSQYGTEQFPILNSKVDEAIALAKQTKEFQPHIYEHMAVMISAMDEEEQKGWQILQFVNTPKQMVFAFKIMTKHFERKINKEEKEENKRKKKKDTSTDSDENSSDSENSSDEQSMSESESDSDDEDDKFSDDDESEENVFEFIKGTARDDVEHDESRSTFGQTADETISAASDVLATGKEVASETYVLSKMVAKTGLDVLSQFLTGGAATFSGRLTDVKDDKTTKLRTSLSQTEKLIFYKEEELELMNQKEEKLPSNSTRGRLFHPKGSTNLFIKCLQNHADEAADIIEDVNPYESGVIYPTEMAMIMETFNIALIDKTTNTMYARVGRFNSVSAYFIIVTERKIGITDAYKTDSLKQKDISKLQHPIGFTKKSWTKSSLPDDLLKASSKRTKMSKSKLKSKFDDAYDTWMKTTGPIRNRGYEKADDIVNTLSTGGKRLRSVLNNFVPNALLDVVARPDLVKCEILSAVTKDKEDRFELNLEEKEVMNNQRDKFDNEMIEQTGKRYIGKMIKLTNVRDIFDEIKVTDLEEKCEIYCGNTFKVSISPREFMAITCFCNVALFDIESDKLYANFKTFDSKNLPMTVIYSKGKIELCNYFDMNGLHMKDVRKWKKWIGNGKTNKKTIRSRL